MASRGTRSRAQCFAQLSGTILITRSTVFMFSCRLRKLTRVVTFFFQVPTLNVNMENLFFFRRKSGRSSGEDVGTLLLFFLQSTMR